MLATVPSQAETPPVKLGAVLRKSERDQCGPRGDEHILPAVEHVRHRSRAPYAGTCLVVPEVIFTTRAQRGCNYSLSAVQIAEIEHNLKGLEPHLMRVPSRGV